MEGEIHFAASPFSPAVGAVPHASANGANTNCEIFHRRVLLLSLVRLPQLRLGCLRQQLLRIMGNTTTIYGRHLAQLVHVTEWIAVDNKKISVAASGDAAEVLLLAQIGRS